MERVAPFPQLEKPVHHNHQPAQPNTWNHALKKEWHLGICDSVDGSRVHYAETDKYGYDLLYMESKKWTSKPKWRETHKADEQVVARGESGEVEGNG